MHPALVAIEAHLGRDRFAEFLSLLAGRCQSDDELLWWMERAWKQVIAQNPTFAAIDLLKIGQICPLHRTNLKSDHVPVEFGTLSSEFIEDRARAFPFANETAMGPCWHEPNHSASADVRYCDQCRQTFAISKWKPKE